MAYSIEYGQDGYTTFYGFKTSNAIPFDWIVNDYNKGLGPAHCNMCKQNGSFEGIFYGLCVKCCPNSSHCPCPCVYCRVAKKDGHKRLERRINMCNFIKSLQSVVDDLRRDYPTDEFGIVKEGIESGLYILNLHMNKQYEKMLVDATPPEEVSCLSIGELIYRWNPSMEVPDSVCYAALKAAERLGTIEWVKALWSEEFTPEKELTPDEQLLADFDKKLKYLRPLQSTSAIKTHCMK